MCLLHSVHIQESEAHQGCNDESSSCDINSQENVHRLRGRYYRNDNRLPGSVLLAKERLVQRLRGVSVSRNRFVAMFYIHFEGKFIKYSESVRY